MDKNRWDTPQWPTFFPLVWILPSPLMKGSPPPIPPFSILETNKHPRDVCNIGWGKGGRITDEKGVFIQTQNIIVSLKALVSIKCLNTFVHDCSLAIKCRKSKIKYIHHFGKNEGHRIIREHDKSPRNYTSFRKAHKMCASDSRLVLAFFQIEWKVNPIAQFKPQANAVASSSKT